ncbi:Hypothetical predicted protein [Olea europaea subsp. europaea]|uniref:Pentatricopeptide repeat-containing protein n=1 Tax=Olea europaea subsp. europaea TaxID=158383 RepID=A0A8S0RYK9_OLEEU|nr:Hypothetical predicted protein [Olea europaea subsp. europaea]
MGSAAALFDKMEKRNIEQDNVTYHTMVSGLIISKGNDGVSELYQKMIEKKFLPKTRTVVLLMKFFWLYSCGRVQQAFECSKQMLERGCLMSELVFQMLERLLLSSSDGRVGLIARARALDKEVKNIVPPSRECAI